MKSWAHSPFSASLRTSPPLSASSSRSPPPSVTAGRYGFYLETVLVWHGLLGFALVLGLHKGPRWLWGQQASGSSVAILQQVKLCHLHADLIAHCVLKLGAGRTQRRGVSEVVLNASGLGALYTAVAPSPQPKSVRGLCTSVHYGQPAFCSQAVDKIEH